MVSFKYQNSNTYYTKRKGGTFRTSYSMNSHYTSVISSSTVVCVWYRVDLTGSSVPITVYSLYLLRSGIYMQAILIILTRFVHRDSIHMHQYH